MIRFCILFSQKFLTYCDRYCITFVFKKSSPLYSTDRNCCNCHLCLNIFKIFSGHIKALIILFDQLLCIILTEICNLLRTSSPSFLRNHSDINRQSSSIIVNRQQSQQIETAETVACFFNIFSSYIKALIVLYDQLLYSILTEICNLL